MPHNRKQLLDAAIGAVILVTMIVGFVWLAHIAEAVFGPENSGLFRRG